MSIFERTLITGAGGMLAHALINALAARGAFSKALNRAALDITDESALKRMFAEHRPTLLLNCAAHTKVDLCEQQQDLANAINGTAVGTMAKLAREYGTYLVHVSTDYVFDGKSSRPYLPVDPVGPQSAYGRSKLLGEQLLQQHAPDRWLIVRTAWVYGRHGPNFPRTMVTVGKQGKPLKVVRDQVGSPTYTVDLAEAILDLVDRSATGIYHVTNSGQTNWFDFAGATLKEFGVTTDLSSTTAAEYFQARPTSAIRPSYSVLDGNKFEQTVGRPMRAWQEGLRDYQKAVERDGF